MSQIPDALRSLHRTGALRHLDCYFADFIQRATKSDDRNLLLASALVSRVLADSHVCLDLEQRAGQEFPSSADKDSPGKERSDEGEIIVEDATETLPSLDTWKESLESEAAQQCVGNAEDNSKPLVLDGNRLYLQRYFRYETKVATTLKERANSAAGDVPTEVAQRLAQLLKSPTRAGDDRQRLAAFIALRNRLAVITGGPGTGKTYTVARILALAIQQQEADKTKKPLKIKIAAPTGKAAVRVAESIGKAKGDMQRDIDPRSLDQIPTGASTIHRLLGYIPDSPYFRHDKSNPLDADLVIIDEVSMIDLALMAKLLDALREDTRLILLGDMDQLASVEPGSVFGDLCRAAQPDRFSPAVRDAYQDVTRTALADPGLKWDRTASNLDNCVVRLYPSHRFPINGPIGGIATVVNEAKADSDEAAKAVWKTAQTKFSKWDVQLQVGKDQTAVQWHDAPGHLTDDKNRPSHDLRRVILAGYKQFLDAGTIEEAFEAVEKFRVFCALRRGPYGVQTLNRLIQEILAQKQMDNVSPELKPKFKLNPTGEFYHRRLIMVTRNDYSLNLFNGDVGIVWEEKDDDKGGKPEQPEDAKCEKDRGQIRKYAFFPASNPDGSKGRRRLAVNMLPEHETAFAMTVHKAQGSQFHKIMLLLPPQDNPMLFTRELLYTAITRAEKEAILWCTEEVFKNCVKRKTQRESGLRERLSIQKGE